MPINAGFAYQKAEQDYAKARTTEEKIEGLKRMLIAAPKHKSSEKLLKQLKERLAKLKQQQEKEAANKKASFSWFQVRKEGAAQVLLIGPTKVGKSTLLNELTGTHATVAPYEFTTKKPEIGILDYHGVKIQLIELPAIVPRLQETNMGPSMFALMRTADLLVLMFNTPQEKAMLDKELTDIDTPRMIFTTKEQLPNIIWKNLPLIKAYTKQPGKEHDYPPIALPKGATIRTLASIIHKDFLKQFKFARIFGASVKHQGSQAGFDHVLADDDVVEIHLR